MPSNACRLEYFKHKGIDVKACKENFMTCGKCGWSEPLSKIKEKYRNLPESIKLRAKERLEAIKGE